MLPTIWLAAVVGLRGAAGAPAAAARHRAAGRRDAGDCFLLDSNLPGGGDYDPPISPGPTAPSSTPIWWSGCRRARRWWPVGGCWGQSRTAPSCTSSRRATPGKLWPPERRVAGVPARPDQRRHPRGAAQPPESAPCQSPVRHLAGRPGRHAAAGPGAGADDRRGSRRRRAAAARLRGAAGPVRRWRSSCTGRPCSAGAGAGPDDRDGETIRAGDARPGRRRWPCSTSCRPSSGRWGGR